MKVEDEDWICGALWMMLDTASMPEHEGVEGDRYKSIIQ